MRYEAEGDLLAVCLQHEITIKVICMNDNVAWARNRNGNARERKATQFIYTRLTICNFDLWVNEHKRVLLAIWIDNIKDYHAE